MIEFTEMMNVTSVVIITMKIAKRKVAQCLHIKVNKICSNIKKIQTHKEAITSHHKRLNIQP